MITFGKVKDFSGTRVVIELVGVDEDATIEALLMQPGSVSGPSVWMPPAKGDIVVVAYDSERPEDSIVLGCVYPDGKNPPRSSKSEIALEANKIFIGDDVNATKPCPREDRVQDQLDAIKRELDAFSQAFSGHTHSVLTVSAIDAAAIVAAAASGSVATLESMVTAGPIPTHANSYVVGSTASDSVEVK